MQGKPFVKNLPVKAFLIFSVTALRYAINEQKHFGNIVNKDSFMYNILQIKNVFACSILIDGYRQGQSRAKAGLSGPEKFKNRRKAGAEFLRYYVQEGGNALCRARC